MKLKWWLKKEKEMLLEEKAFQEKQYLYTEKLLEKALEKFSLDPESEMVYFDPFESTETRRYISELCRNNLINDEYMNQLCQTFGLKFSANVETECDYPTIYFKKIPKKTYKKYSLSL